MVYITARAVAYEQTIEELLRISKEYVECARETEGCMNIGYSTDDLKVSVEQWRDQGIYEAHAARPETRAFSKRLRELVTQPVEVQAMYQNRVSL